MAQTAQELARLSTEAGSPSTFTPEEWQQRRAWNDTRRDYPKGECAHQLFEAQVDRTPDAVAVLDGAEQIRFRALEERANRIAHALKACGVGRESRVAVAVAPSADALAALLGVLKAGAGYVPLDLEAPDERLRLILADAQVKAVLADGPRQPLFQGAPCPVIAVDGAQVREQPSSRPSVPVQPRNLAYVVYTSGSTGQPKGVMVEHRSMVNHNRAMAELLSLAPADRVLQFTPLNFDAAGEEIYPTLLAGATVVIHRDLIPAHTFSDVIDAEKLTVLSLPPSYMQEWALFLSQKGRKVPSCLRLVLLGGDKLLPETFALWHAVGGARVPWLNVYGPTEATVTSAVCRLEGERALQEPVLPIGGPVPNAQLHILDENLQPVPVGVTGELYIAGAGLARGYVGRPDQTAERFVPDPFSSEPGARMYRSGDLARYLPDGRIHFVGRVDHQVKIRGMRVELGEVESALRADPGVADAVVVAVDDGRGGKRLVGYVVPQPGLTLHTPGVRDALRSTLPDYMVPGVVMALEKLPLSSNGKVDRKALPVPPPEAGSEANYVAPRNELEEQLCAIWARVLSVPRVGIRDDFFELGGQSLTAMRLVAEVRDELGMELQLQEVFESPTISELVERFGPMPDVDVNQLSDEQVEAMLRELQSRARD